MFLKKTEDKDQRDRIIAYKKIFKSEMGKHVLFDLMNRFHILNSHGGEALKEGQRSVVLHIMSQCNIDIAQFDKLLRGELENDDAN